MIILVLTRDSHTFPLDGGRVFTEQPGVTREHVLDGGRLTLTREACERLGNPVALLLHVSGGEG